MREIVAELRDRRAAAARRWSGRARTPPAAASWRSRTRTPSRATPPASTIVFGEDIDPDDAIAQLDAVTFDEVAEVARRVEPGRARRRLRRTAPERRLRLTVAVAPRRPLRDDSLRRGRCADALNERELGRYVRRVGDRWPLARRDRRRRARRRRARRPAPARARRRSSSSCSSRRASTECRGSSASTRRRSLWDAAEMGAQADVHCYTPAEFERKREALPVVAMGRRARIRPARLLSPV